MSKHPIQAIDDLFKTTAMDFGLMADEMRDDLPAILAQAEQAKEESE